MSVIGSGHYVMLELWNDGELVHSGVLNPGESTGVRFVEGAVSVSRFTLTRLTKDEVEALPPSEEDPKP